MRPRIPAPLPRRRLHTLTSVFPSQPPLGRTQVAMEWVSSRPDPAHSLLQEFSPRLNLPQASEFSTLETGLLATGSTPTVAGEWPLPHVSRNSRNDFQYEFSLSAGPEFDTESADGGEEREAIDEDNVSSDVNLASASEDTSVGVDAPSGSAKERFAELEEMRTSPFMSPLTPDSLVRGPEDDKKNAKGARHSAGSAAAVVSAKGVQSSKPATSQKPGRTILKKKSATTSRKTAGKGMSSSTPSMSMSQGNSGGQSGALSHTKMCRDRLNNMFERLRHTLPPAPTGVEVKHKAQVLDYAIAVLHGMVDRTAQLEIELAVSSNKATMDWISKLVARTESFPEAAEEVMRLFARRRSWKHAELWVAGKRSMPPDANLEESTLLTLCTSISNDVYGRGASSLDRFSKQSESYSFKANEGVQGRVWSAMRPEWVTGLTDPKNFKRCSLAREHGVKVCLAVPVTITGKIEAVMCFYDVKHRPYDTQCRELAMRLAWALGNAVGGKRAKVNILTASGTSTT